MKTERRIKYLQDYIDWEVYKEAIDEDGVDHHRYTHLGVIEFRLEIEWLQNLEKRENQNIWCEN